MLEGIKKVSMGRSRNQPGRILPGIGCLVAGTLLTTSAAHAQDALLSELSLYASPVSTSNPAPPPPDALHLGPVQLTLGAYTGVEANDNINTAQTRQQSDLILHDGLNLGFIWPATAQSSISFYSSVGYAKYLEHPDNDRFEIEPGSALTWQMSFEDGSVTFSDQFSDSQAVISEASVSGLSKLPRIDNTIGVRTDWQPGRWLLEAGYSHDTYFSDDATFEYLNRNSEYFFLRAGHRIIEDTQLGVEASASLTDYEIHLQSNNTSYSIGPYLEWKITDSLSVSARGGYTMYAFDANGPLEPAQNLSSYYASVDLTDQLTQFISQKLSVERDISLGYNQGNNYTEQLTASYFVNWAATTHLALNLNLTYEVGNQPLTIPIFEGVSFTETENYNRVGISPGLSYQFTTKLGGSLNFAHWERTSNISGNGYQNNILTLQLNYSF
jgi:hypothetical protein